MAEEQARPMKYPYTFTARLAQFPLKFYINNNWIYKYYFIGIAAALPVFVYINRLANSPQNKKAKEVYLAKQRAEHHH